MPAVLDHACRRCGRPHPADDRVCDLCGELLRSPDMPRVLVTPPVPASAEQVTPRTHAGRVAADVEALDERRARREPWIFLALGLATAPVFAWTPLLGFMGWFLASLVHEMGHAGFAWLCGMPAMPVISLAGEAAAVHGEQSLLFVAFVCAALVALVRHFIEGRARWIVLGVVVPLHLALALTGAKELMFLLSGHAGELAFATLCLWKALDGGFTASKLERALYGTVGWYLLGRNVILCFGLMTSAAARAEYEANGSFGLLNDLARAAEEVLDWRVESVALLMLAASACVLPAALLLWRTSRTLRDRP